MNKTRLFDVTEPHLVPNSEPQQPTTTNVCGFDQDIAEKALRSLVRFPGRRESEKGSMRWSVCSMASARNPRFPRCHQVATGVVMGSVLLAINSAVVHAFTNLMQQAATRSGTGTSNQGQDSRITCLADSTAAAAAAASSRNQVLIGNFACRPMRTVFRWERLVCIFV